MKTMLHRLCTWLRTRRKWFWTRVADIRRPRSLYFLVTHHLETHPLPVEPCGLLLKVPHHDWEWLTQQNDLVREYEAGLTELVRSYLKHRELPPLIRQVKLAEGEVWELKWFMLQTQPSHPTNSEALSNTQHSAQVVSQATGVFVVPNPSGARYIDWFYPSRPRIPFSSEASASPTELEQVLQSLIPEAGDRLWNDGEAYTVCSCRVRFYSEGKS